MTAREGEQRPVKPVYLSGVLTAGAELSAGYLYDGSAHADNASPVVALVFTGGAAMLFTEGDSGQLTRLRIRDPGSSALPMTRRASSPGRGSSPRLSLPPRPRRSTAMAVLESPDYRAAREGLHGNPVIAMMAAGVATVPLAELADGDGTPRSHLMNQANSAFDDAEARTAGNPAYEPYPKDAHRHLGLIAEAVLAERAAMRTAVASALAPPGTDPESGSLSSQRVEVLDTKVCGPKQGC